MDLLLEKILSIVASSVAILLIILSEQMFKINRKKAITSFILSLIYTGFVGYYIYLSFYVKTPKSILKKEIAYSKTSFVILNSLIYFVIGAAGATGTGSALLGAAGTVALFMGTIVSATDLLFLDV